MKRVIGVAALLLLLAAIGGGWYLYREWFGIPGSSGRADDRSPGSGSAGWDLPTPELLGDSPSWRVATLTRFQKTVRHKRNDDLSWEKARRRMPLRANDAVRTFEQATALVNFGAGDLLEIDENSLVVIMPRAPQAGGNEFALALLSPDLLDGMEQQSPDEQQQALQDAALDRQIRISPVPDSGAGDGKRHVKVRTMPDGSAALVSLQGDLRLIGPNGEQQLLKEAMVARLTSGGELIAPRRLPAAPSLIGPRDGASYLVTRKSPRVEFSWSEVDRADVYRVLVARDRRFRAVFADERVRRTSFTVSNLEPGTYYWRVRSSDAEGFEGSYSTVRSIRAIEDETPPRLTILRPPEMFVSPAQTTELAGRTDRDARVRVNGEAIRVAADGSFRHVVSLKEGINLINIEVADAAGNTEYGKRLITYRGARRTHTAGVGH